MNLRIDWFKMFKKGILSLSVVVASLVLDDPRRLSHVDQFAAPVRWPAQTSGPGQGEWSEHSPKLETSGPLVSHQNDHTDHEKLERLLMADHFRNAEPVPPEASRFLEACSGFTSVSRCFNWNANVMLNNTAQERRSIFGLYLINQLDFFTCIFSRSNSLLDSWFFFK